MSTSFAGPHRSVEQADSLSPHDYLVRCRRRQLVIGLLKLCFFAAIFNEAYRWLFIAVYYVTDYSLPRINIGPYFLVVAAFYYYRRLSLKHTAKLVDKKLDFADRLKSYVDFSSREDLSPDVVRAQMHEVGCRLKGTSINRLLPLRMFHGAGPVLLLAVLLYPFILASYYKKPLPLPLRYGVEDIITDSGVVDGGPSFHQEGEEPQHLPDTRPPPREFPDSVSGQGVEPNLPDGNPTLEAVAEGEPPPEEDTIEAAGNEADLSNIEIKSKRRGRQLSPVVDALPDDAGGTPPTRQLPKGTLSFRLLPGDAGEEGTSGHADTTAPPFDVTVDFESIPQRYRQLVKNYFSQLATPAR